MTIPNLMESAQLVLGEGPLENPVQLESESLVVRARVAASGRTVVVKNVTDTGFDRPGHRGAPQRFLNEWAGLALLDGLGARIAPSVIAADVGKRLIILEDLGDAESLESVLLSDRSGRAWDGLGEFGAALAELHCVTRGHEDRFDVIQQDLGTTSPISDTTVDQRSRRDMFESCLGAAGLEMNERIWRSFKEVERLTHEPSPFRVLAHADAGPHNVLLTEEGARLIDFEFCVFRNALSDMAGARLGFPQTNAAMGVPPVAVRHFESSYRAAVSERIPEAADDAQFSRALGAACAHWTLNRVAAAWRLHVEPRLEAVADLPDGEAERIARTATIVEGFSSYAAEVGVFAELADVIHACVRHWREVWPVIGTVPVYPALRNDG